MRELDDTELPGVYDAPPESAELSAEERARVIAGRYEIVERLGEGGMGQVLLVRHRRLGKAFALKLMQAEFSSDPEAEQIFHREARLASHLSHPAIVAMVDFGHDPDWGWFIVMEYLEGEPLSKRIEQLGTLPIAVACEVAAQLAQALEHSHGKGVVHADLKSENVLCLTPTADQEQRRWQVKLLDFGTAHLASAVAGQADRITGTPEYIAPERATGGPPLPSVDLYAVGIILYEMLVGAPPFTGEPGEVLRRHLSETPEPAGARRGEVLDARLDAILERTLAKDPADRYPTAQALLDDLRSYLDVLGVRQRAGLLPTEATAASARGDASSAAFDALSLPAAGLRRDGTIVIANHAFARLLRADDPRALEGRSAFATQLLELNPELQDDLRVVALNGKVIRRDLAVSHRDREVTLRYILTPTAGACGHCMLVLHVVA